VAKPTQKYTQSDIGHGRIETRTCTCLTGLDFIRDADKWKDLTSIIKVDSVREFKNSDKLTECSTRYYISSLDGSAEDFAKCIRSHWGIENSLHWTLDVAFGEDASRKRLKNASQNFSILNKIALNLLKNEKTNKSGVKGKRLKAGWDNHYLIKALNLMKF
jgi:predicted transposase YbfD/YdcC